MTNKRIRLYVAIGLIGTLASATFIAVAQESGNRPKNSDSARVASLREQLENGLKATTSQDKLYIDRVIQLVETGRLSRGFVNYVYKLSIRKRPESPLPYFRRAMTALATQFRVTI